MPGHCREVGRIRCTLIEIISFLVVFSLAPAALWAAPDDPVRPLWGEETYSGRLKPGQSVVVRIVSGPVAGFSIEEPVSVSLTATARQAVGVAPAWLRPRLSYRFRSYSPALQDRLASIILAPDDPRTIDEIAFAVATVPPEEVWADDFDERLLAWNASLVYEAAGRLEYVELVEVGDPEADDDFHTTARYRILNESGDPVWYDLPPDQYYWYVVHPMVGGEAPIFIDPRSGRPAPPEEGGVHWRDFYLLEQVQTDSRASLHFVLEHPHQITDDDLQGWDAQELFVLDSTAIDPINLALESGSGEPVLIHYSYPGRNHDGVVIATTLPVEQMYEDSRPALLENLVRAGNASATLPEEATIALIKERDPFGAPTVETALQDAGYAYDVYSATQIPEIDLSGYMKVIVPSDQPRALYVALADSTQLFYEYMSRDPDSEEVVYQFHGATRSVSATDHWDDLVMPGGLRAVHPAPGVVSAVDLGGYPMLLHVLEGADILWDGQHQSLSGRLPLPADAQAVLRIGYYGTQNTPDRCSEMPYYYRGPDGTDPPGPGLVQGLRTNFPQRTLYLHYGNCGEMQQVLGAAGRSALVPMVTVDAWADDHVWNELRWEDGWRNYTINRSDSSVSVSTEGLVGDHWAGTFITRGDGYVENATDRYTDPITLAVTVTDADGRAVDGARLMVATEYNKMVGDSTPLTPMMVAWTDSSGEASIDLGTDRDFYLMATSPLGYLPGPEDNIVALVACREETASCPGTTEPGTIIPVAMTYETSLPAPPVASAVAGHGAISDDDSYLQFSLTRVDEVLEDQAFADQTFERWLGPGVVDVTVLDATEYAHYAAGEQYTAVVEQRGVNTTEVNLPIPTVGGEYFVVVANTGRASLHQDVALSAQTYGAVPATVTVIEPTDEGCGCRATSGGGHPPVGLPLCCVLVLLLIRRRHTRWRALAGLVLPVGLAAVLITTLLAATSCAPSGGEEDHEAHCADQVDNDGDGAADCQDPDCYHDPACAVGVEICGNTVDDDGDGATDCDDSDCLGDPVCTSSPEVCDNATDDDGDGAIDCYDSDCQEDPHCQVQGALSCNMIGTCAFCCPEGDDACRQACHDAGTPEAQAQDDAIKACQEATCQTECGPSGSAAACNTCTLTSCVDELNGCTYATDGAGGCTTLDSCLAGCPDLPQAGSGSAAACPMDPGITCPNACFVSVDQQAVDLSYSLYVCRSSSCGTECYGENATETDCTGCVQAYCPNELTACEQDG